MRVTAMVARPDEPVPYYEKYGTATVKCHFPGGVSITVHLISTLSDYGEGWNVVSIRARYYRDRQGGRDKTKSEKIWSGEEIDQISHLWMNKPSRWR